MKNLLGAFTRFLAHITRDPVGMAGAVITTVSAVLFSTLLGLELVGFHGGPYLGILAFVVIPGLFLLGLRPGPDRPVARAGAAAQSGRGRRAGAPTSFPCWDLNVARVRRNLLVFVGLSVVNLVILARRHLQGRRGDGLDAVLRAGLPLGDAPRVHDLPALPARPRALRRVPHRPGGGLVREVEAVGLVAARLGDVRPVSPAHPRPRPQPAARARDLRAVPLAAEVRGRPLQGEHALRGRRGEHAS